MSNPETKKQPVGFRLSPTYKQGIEMLADIWSVSQQEIFERAIRSFLAENKEAIRAGRELEQERIQRLKQLQQGSDDG